MPRIFAWSTASLSARAEVANRLVAKGLKLALKPITADISQIVTAAAASPSSSAEAPALAPPPAGPAPTVALLGLEGIAATWGAFVDTELFPYVVQTFVDSTTDIAGDLTSALGDVIMPVGNAYAEEYLAQAKNRLKNISDLLWQSARDELVFGLEQGFDMPQMAAAVKQAAGVAEPRAMVIARTEVIGAANAGSIIQMRAAGFEPGTVTKEWLSTHDTRTRPAHEDADGQTVDLDEPFIVGREALDRPLDPNGSPGNVIDCRCAMAFDFVDAPLTSAFDESQVKRDSEGKFAKKAGFKLPDFDALSYTGKSEFIKSITPEQWHQLSAEDQHSIELIADEIDAIDDEGTLGVSGHIENLQLSEPDDDVDGDITPGINFDDMSSDEFGTWIKALTVEIWSTLTPEERAQFNANINSTKATFHPDYQKLQKKYNKIFNAWINAPKATTPTIAPTVSVVKDDDDDDGVDDDLDFSDSEKVLNTSLEDWLAMSDGQKEELEDIVSDAFKNGDDDDGTLGEHLDALKTEAAEAIEAETIAPTPTFTLGTPKPINTKTVYKDKYADAEVVAVNGTGKNRLVWDEAAKKFLVQFQTDTGAWQTTAALGKGETYNTFKGDTGWFAPAVVTATPTSTVVPSTVPTVTSPITDPGVGGFPSPTSLKSTGKKLGTHGAVVYKDQATGKEWLFKPAYKKYTAEVDVATAKFQQQAGLVTPKITTMTVDGKFGSLQEVVPQAKDAFPGTFDASKLSKQDLQTLLQHQVLDWFIGNHDSHKGNFVRAPDGTLVGVDKGQAFKFYNGDQLSTDFHINEHPSVYAQLWQQYEQGKVDITDADLAAAFNAIESLQNIDPDDLDNWLKPYYTGAATSGDLLKKYFNGQLKPKSNLPANDPDAFMAAVEDRQAKLSQDFATFYALQKIKKANTTGTATPAPAVTTSPAPIASPGGPGDVSPGSGPVGLSGIPAEEATTTKSGLIASTSAIDPTYGHVIVTPGGALFGYVKNISGTPPKWVFTNPQGNVSAPFISNFLHGALVAISHGSDGNGTSTKPINTPGSVPTSSLTGTPVTAPATSASVPSLPSTITHSKKLLNTKTIYKDTHKHNEVVAVNQLGERLLWNESFKKFQLQAIASDGKWSNKGFFGKGEAFKKFGKDTHWFAPNPSDQGSGSTGPVPTIAPSPGVTPITPSGPVAVNVAPAPAAVQQQAALSGIDVPEELLPPPADPTDVPAPPPIPVIKGLNADYSTLDIDQKQKIGFHAKALPTKPPAENFSGAMAALNATPNVNIAQVLAYLDAKNVKFGGEPNFYTKQIVDWLRTPDGKKAAQKIVANAAAASTASTTLPYQKGIDLKPYTIGTPSTTDTHFPKYSPSQMQTMQSGQNPPWTTTQSAALKKYTGSAYVEMNEYLRTGIGIDATKKSVENAQNGMRPMPFPILVTRGTGSFFGKTQPSLSELQAMVGVTVRDKGFLSTAVQGGGFGGKYSLEIEVPSGTPAAYVGGISLHPTEKELLLAAGLKYQIIEIKGGTYPTVVRMRVVP
jgi:hypothetical protein